MKHTIGILGASDIAYKRFLPALEKSGDIGFAGIASRDPARCARYTERFGGRIYPDYEALLRDPDIDCVYLPLPPALHAVWGEKALRAGKHLLMEKPFSADAGETRRLLSLAEEQGLAVHENYMFLYHRQLKRVRELMEDGTLGTVRMIRTAFTFPFRGAEDFRYQKALGGGALLDCGGYPLLLASVLLGERARLVWAGLTESAAYQVDTAGSAVLRNDAGLTAHVFFGMDDTYRCELEVWGSRASLTADRIFTAPTELDTVLRLRVGNEEQLLPTGVDDQFFNSICAFAALMEDPALRQQRSEEILRQSLLLSAVRQYEETKRSI